MKRTRCSSCDSPELNDILDLGASPLADEFHLTAQRSIEAQHYPLGLVECDDCHLVQIGHIIPDQDLYGRDYAFYTSTSKPLVAYQQQLASWVLHQFPRTTTGGLVEIACNDGTLLRHFQKAGVRCLGVDPARGPATQAAEEGLDVIIEPFNVDVAARIVDEHGHAGIVIANNVAAHVSDLRGFLSGIATLLNRDSGVALLEVQYLPDLLLTNGYDMVYHEHRYFFSATTLVAAAHKVGLVAFGVWPTPMQGGSIRVGFVRADQPGIATLDRRTVENCTYRELWLSRPGAHAGMQAKADLIRTRLRAILAGLVEDRKTIAGYGAPAKASTLVHWCGLTSYLDHMVDTTPAKIGRYLPGTKLRIEAPGPRHPHVYLLTAWNYLSQIIGQEHQFLADGGRWVLPIPVPVTL